MEFNVVTLDAALLAAQEAQAGQLTSETSMAALKKALDEEQQQAAQLLAMMGVGQNLNALA